MGQPFSQPNINTTPPKPALLPDQAQPNALYTSDPITPPRPGPTLDPFLFTHQQQQIAPRTIQLSNDFKQWQQRSTATTTSKTRPQTRFHCNSSQQKLIIHQLNSSDPANRPDKPSNDQTVNNCKVPSHSPLFTNLSSWYNHLCLKISDFSLFQLWFNILGK